MKIDGELRMAIRAAERVQPKAHMRTAVQAQAEEAALSAFRKKSERYQAAKKLLLESRKLENKARVEMIAMGLMYHGGRIDDLKKFIKAGGKLEVPKVVGFFRADAVIAELAAAPANQLKRILKKYNIDWS